MVFDISMTSLRSVMVLVVTVLISATLGGKRRCFSVLVAYLHNQTNCDPVTQSVCSISTLNWVGDFGPALSYLGTSILTNMIKVKHSHESGRIGNMKLVLQFGLILIFGCVTSSFVMEYESLVVTDAIIQGIGASAMMSLAALKMESVFPKHHRYHVLATALCDGSPWGVIFMCPLYGLVLSYGMSWQSIYLVVACLLIVECLLASLVDEDLDDIDIRQIEPGKEMFSLAPIEETRSQVEATTSSGENKSPSQESKVEALIPLEPESEDNEDDLAVSSPYKSTLKSAEKSCTTDPCDAQNSVSHPHFSEYMTFDNLSYLLCKPVIAMWCVERLLFYMSIYGVFMNVVDYMMVVLQDNLLTASMVTLTFAGGEIVSFIIAVAIGDYLTRHRLLQVDFFSAAISSVILFSWQMVHLYRPLDFSNKDVHFMVFILGFVTAFSNTYAFKLSEDITGQKGYIANMLTNMAQALGLFLAPITSGMLIQGDGYDSFFIVQSGLNLIRAGFIVGIMYKFHKETLASLTH